MTLGIAALCLAGCQSHVGPASSSNPNLADYVIEQRPSGTVRTNGDALVIEDAEGCTVWLRRKLTAPVEIEYDVTVVSHGGAHDRVSDVNCFWMATDPTAPDGCPFAPGHGRSGKFSDYDSLRTYYVGMGGNNNTTTRFRKYDGRGAKPLLPEFDLRARDVLLEPNRTYRLRVVAHDGVAAFWRDGKRLFAFHDPAPLTSGWFGFRTVQSHLEIRHVTIRSE